jgi:hypothetical protein
MNDNIDIDFGSFQCFVSQLLFDLCFLLTLNVYICNTVVDTVIKMGEPYLWCNECSP